MYRLILAYGILLGFLIPSPAMAEPEVLYVTGQSLNLRASADSKAAKVGTANRGQLVTVLDRQGQWVQVRTTTGEIAWAHSAYLSAQRPSSGEHQIGQTDSQIRQRLIQQSMARYSGSCPCPKSVDRAGNLCGGRSAYARKGGADVLCYERDVTDEMVANHRANHPE